LVAGSPHSGVETLFRRLPPEPPHPGFNPARWLSYRAPRTGYMRPGPKPMTFMYGGRARH
jgi:hypothetical protein